MYKNFTESSVIIENIKVFRQQKGCQPMHQENHAQDDPPKHGNILVGVSMTTQLTNSQKWQGLRPVWIPNCILDHCTTGTPGWVNSLGNRIRSLSLWDGKSAILASQTISPRCLLRPSVSDIAGSEQPHQAGLLLSSGQSSVAGIMPLGCYFLLSEDLLVTHRRSSSRGMTSRTQDHSLHCSS